MDKSTALITLPNFGTEIAVPGEWLEQRDRALELAGAIVAVEDAGTYDLASESLGRVTRISNALDKKRLAFSKPFTAMNKKIKEMCDGERVQLEEEKARLKKMSGAYVVEQERKAREARAQAEKEERAEAERQFAAQQAVEEARAQASILDDVPEPVTEIVVPKAAAPVIEEAHSSASRITKRLVWHTEDEDEVPRAFMMLDSRKVNEYMRETKDSMLALLDGGKDGREFIAGIRFEVKTDVSGRG